MSRNATVALGRVHDVGGDVSGDDPAEQAVLHDHAPPPDIVPHACQPPEALRVRLT